jgi:hypothetical protein
MANRETFPPTDPAPQDAPPNAAQLKADINAGATADKVPGFDPAAAPLGTDEEAGGAGPTAIEVAQARRAETSRGADLASTDGSASAAATDLAAARRVSPSLVVFALAAVILLGVVLWVLGRSG